VRLSLLVGLSTWPTGAVADPVVYFTGTPPSGTSGPLNDQVTISWNIPNITVNGQLVAGLEINAPNAQGGNFRQYVNPDLGSFNQQGSWDFGVNVTETEFFVESQGGIVHPSVVGSTNPPPSGGGATPATTITLFGPTPVFAPIPTTHDTVSFGFLGPNATLLNGANSATPSYTGMDAYTVQLGAQTVAQTVAGFFGEAADSKITLTTSGMYKSTVDAQLEGQNVVVNGTGTFMTPTLGVAGNVSIMGGTVNADRTVVDNALQTDGVAFQGSAPTSTTMTVSGGSTFLIADTEIDVGQSTSGPAKLDLENNAHLLTGGVVLGYNGPGAEGDLTVNGGASLTAGTGGDFNGIGFVYAGYATGDVSVVNVTGGGSVNSQGTIIGYMANSMGNVTVDGSHSIWQVDYDPSYGYLAIGYGSSAANSMTVSNNALASSADFTSIGGWAGGGTGETGNGTLTIASGGKVFSGIETSDGGTLGAAVGFGTNSTGIVLVTGANSEWDVAQRLDLGYSDGSAGTVTVKAGGELSVDGDIIRIARTASSSGTLTFDGTGGSPSLTFSSDGSEMLLVGDAGTGTLNVQSGAVIRNAGSLVVGNLAGSNGTVMVTGQGSILNVPGDVMVGENGTGTLRVSNGAKFDAGSNGSGVLTIGDEATGTAVVDGAGTVMTAENELVVGLGAGHGTLTVSGGALVTAKDVAAGTLGATGTIDITGSSSKLSISDDLRIAAGSTGQLTVEQGAIVTDAQDLLISQTGGANGTLTLTGAGTSVTMGGNAMIGVAGPATVSLSNGAALTTNMATLASQAGSSATVTLDSGSNWQNPGNFFVGGAGAATVTISGGSTLTAGLAILGSAGGSGTVTVTGSGSMFSTPFELFVGGGGAGELDVNNGGQVTAENLDIGTSSSGAGTVNINGTNSSLTTNTLTVGGTSGHGTLTLSNSGSVISSGNGMIGFQGTVNVAGGGSLTVGGGGGAAQGSILISSGGALINAGLIEGNVQVSSTSSLVDNGAIHGDLTVATGGKVSGAGLDSVTGTFINNGSLTPGDDPGSFTVVGDYTQGATGVLNIEVEGTTPGSPTGYSVLHVTGNATLGGTLKLTYLNGFKPSLGQTYDFLNVDGTTTNNFASLEIIGLLTEDVVGSFTPDSVTITSITRDYSNPSLNAQLTSNQRAVGSSLNSVANSATGDLNTLLTSIDNLGTAQQIGQAFDQLSPQRLQIFRSIAFDNYSFFTQQLDDHFANLRDGMTGLDTTGFAFSDAALGSSLSQIKGHLLAWQPEPTPGLLSDTANPVLGGVNMSDNRVSENDRWSAFITGNVTLADLDSSTDVSHSSYSTGGITLGADYRLNRNWTVGALFGYNHTDADLDNENSTATVDTYSPGLYAAYTNQGWYANGIFNYGYNSYTENRNIIFSGTDRTAIGAPQGNQYSTDLDGGYEFHLGDFTVGPSLGLNYVHLDINSFSEGDAGAASLNIQEQSADSLRSRLGFDARWQIRYLATQFTYHLSAHWQHEFMDNSQSIVSSLESPGDTAFTVQGTGPDRDSALIDAGVDVLATRNVDLFVDYQNEAGESSFYAQSVQAGVKIGF
jgi:outer membrane autotransporter protein